LILIFKANNIIELTQEFLEGCLKVANYLPLTVAA